MERTKAAIVDAFQQELEETPINKITVKSIVERCNVTRNTFYYYFNDIPDLMECLLTSMADQLMDSFDQPDAIGEMRRMVLYLNQKKKSVLHIYRYLPREKFLFFLDKISVYAEDRHMRRVTQGQNINEDDLSVLIHFYKCALVGLSLDWLDSGMNYDMDSMVTRLGLLMEGSVENVIEKSKQLSKHRA